MTATLFIHSLQTPLRQQETPQPTDLLSRYQRLQFHYNLCQILLNGGLELKGQLLEVARHLCVEFAMTQVNLYVTDREETQLMCLASYAPDLTHYADRTGARVRLDERHWLTHTLLERQAYWEPGRLLLPLSDEKRCLGVMEILGVYDDDQSVLESLETVACQLGSHVREYRRLQLAQQLALTDGLTSVANHRHFQNVLQTHLNDDILLSLLLIDIDHFKQLNDTYGHLYGDHILARMGEILSRAVRGGDLVARYGGEEFAVLLPDTCPEGAQEVAERIRQSVADETFIGQDGVIQVTVSIGWATRLPGGHEREALIKEADGHLYRAKRQGRNRVCGEAPSLIIPGLA